MQKITGFACIFPMMKAGLNRQDYLILLYHGRMNGSCFMNFIYSQENGFIRMLNIEEYKSDGF